MNRPLILALDVGTSSVRAALYDHSGNVLPETMVKNERSLTATEGGGAEIDAALAFKQVVAAVDNVLDRARGINGEITHVASAAFWHSLVGVDAAGRPSTKVFGWADTRSRDAVDTLRKKLDETEMHDRTGARFHSSFWPAKLMWLKRSAPERFRKTAYWLSFSDYTAMKLCGDAVTSISMASGTGIFDIRECDWDAELPGFLKLRRSQLPAIAGPSETFRLNRNYAKRWPRLKNAEWFPAIGDGAANNIGAGCIKRSKAALMIGTSGAMRVAYRGRPPEKIPSGLWCYRVDRERPIIGGALSDGGGLYQWLKEILRVTETDDHIEAEIAKRPPAGHGLSFLPFVAGERSTGYHENASGAVIGLKTTTDAIDIVQAALESVAYRFAEVFDQLNSVCRIRQIVASGGALRASPVWTKIIADVAGRDLSLPDTREASSRGAVLHALEEIGEIQNIENLSTPKGLEFPFDEKRHHDHLSARKKHEALYRRIIDTATRE